METEDTSEFLDDSELEDGGEARPDGAVETAPPAGGATDKTAGEAGAAAGKEGADKGDLKALREELNSLRGRVTQAEDATRFWYDKATASAGTRAAAKPEEEETPALTVDLVEAVSSNDPKQVAKALRELGFVDQKTVDAKLNQARAASRTDERLYSDFPDLRKETSPFFEATKKYYQELIADDPEAASRPATIRAAARLAQGDIAREAARGDRVRRQAGDAGRRPTRTPEDDELTATQRSIVARFAAAGANVTEEGYRKRAQAGVQMSGVRTRR